MPSSARNDLYAHSTGLLDCLSELTSNAKHFLFTDHLRQNGLGDQKNETHNKIFFFIVFHDLLLINS